MSDDAFDPWEDEGSHARQVTHMPNATIDRDVHGVFTVTIMDGSGLVQVKDISIEDAAREALECLKN